MYNLRTREAAINNDNNTSDCENTALGSQFQPGIFFIGCSGAGTLQLDTPQTKLEHFAPLNEKAFFWKQKKGYDYNSCGKIGMVSGYLLKTDHNNRKRTDHN